MFYRKHKCYYILYYIMLSIRQYFLLIESTHNLLFTYRNIFIIKALLKLKLINMIVINAHSTVVDIA